MKGLLVFLAAAIFVVGLPSSTLGTTSGGTAALRFDKKRCHFVTKKIHGKKKRVRVCTTVKAPPKPQPKPQPQPQPQAADVALTKAAPASAAVGSNLSYTITARNNGPDTRVDTEVRDSLPANVAFVSAASSSGSCAGSLTIVCSGMTANPTTITIVVRPTAAGTLTNTATISSATADPHIANNSSTATTVVTAPLYTLTSPRPERAAAR